MTSFNNYKVNLWDKQLDIGDIAKLKIYVNNKSFFEARNLNVFTNYMITFFNEELINKWLAKCDMTFYQNQLNFAVWCATSGCGVSAGHLKSTENLLSSVFKFHIYYQSRKILEEMSCPIPGDQIFNATDNNINMLKHQKLCNEFNVSPSEDFRFKGGDNGGLGTMYNYTTNFGYRPLRKSWQHYNSTHFKFSNQSGNDFIKIDYIKQDAAAEGWKQFIPETSSEFTRAGVVRLDDSIRNYVHCVLGSQAQTRSSILTSLETQQYFIDLLEENIKSEFSIPESIAKYQDAITKTYSKIDYVVAIGLYMIPSDLVLKSVPLVGYNNNIVIASHNMTIGHNEMLNTESVTLSEPILTRTVDPPTRPTTTTVSPVYLSVGISLVILAVFYVYKA